MSKYLKVADFSGFKYKELGETIELLKAYRSSIISLTGLTVNYGMFSDSVFLSDEDYRCFMIKDGKLKEWFICPECSKEGFEEDWDKTIGEKSRWNDCSCKDIIIGENWKDCSCDAFKGYKEGDNLDILSCPLCQERVYSEY